jgi:hypothetical protein
MGEVVRSKRTFTGSLMVVILASGDGRSALNFEEDAGGRSEESATLALIGETLSRFLTGGWRAR